MPKIIWRRVPGTLVWLLVNPHVFGLIILSGMASVVCLFLYWISDKLDDIARLIRKWNRDSDNKVLSWPTVCDSLIDWCKVKK